MSRSCPGAPAQGVLDAQMPLGLEVILDAVPLLAPRISAFAVDDRRPFECRLEALDAGQRDGGRVSLGIDRLLGIVGEGVVEYIESLLPLDFLTAWLAFAALASSALAISARTDRSGRHAASEVRQSLSIRGKRLPPRGDFCWPVVRQQVVARSRWRWDRSSAASFPLRHVVERQNATPCR
jgi:hypothetical protein